MHTLPQLLIIAGTGQNTGKTTLVRLLLEQFAPHTPLYAVKTTPHFYPLTPGLVEVARCNRFTVCEETNSTTRKDSSTMLASGASRVFLIMAPDCFLLEALEVVLRQLPPHCLLIAESTGLGLCVTPGLLVILTRNHMRDAKPGVQNLYCKPHYPVNTDLVPVAHVANSISILNHQWTTT